MDAAFEQIPEHAPDSGRHEATQQVHRYDEQQDRQWYDNVGLQKANFDVTAIQLLAAVGHSASCAFRQDRTVDLFGDVLMPIWGSALGGHVPGQSHARVRQRINF